MVGVSLAFALLVLGAFLTALTGDIRFPGEWLWYRDAAVIGLEVGGLGGGIIGLGQWLILRSNLEQAWRWILFTSLGFAVGSIPMMMVIVPSRDERLFIEVIGYFLPLFLGAVVGLAQWLVLRTQFDRAIHWVWLSGLSWIICFVSFAVFHFIRDNYLADNFQDELLSGGIGGILYGVMTAIVLIWVVKPSPFQPSSQRSEARDPLAIKEAG